MVATDPKLNQRRLWWERLLWITDLLAYAVIGVSGFLALGRVSDYVYDTLLGQTWIIMLFAWLMLGGWVALIGRATRLWALEYVGNVAAGWGTAVYAVVLFPGALSGVATFAAFGMTVATTLYMARRYDELVIFTSEPGDSDGSWLNRVRRRRTKNTVPRQHF